MLSEYTYFYISKSITSYTLLLFKIVKSAQCILNLIQDGGCQTPPPPHHHHQFFPCYFYKRRTYTNKISDF